MGNDIRSYDSRTNGINIFSKEIEEDAKLDFSNLKLFGCDSSYNGLKTCVNSQYNIENVKNKIDTPTDCSTITEDSYSKDNKIPTIFEWTGGGNNILLIGSFSNWKQSFLMTQNKDKYEMTLVIKYI